MPLVAVPGRLSSKAEGLRTAAVAAGQAYLRALRHAGAEGVVVLPEVGGTDLEQLLARLDGLLLLGGGDIDPSRYGAERHEKVSAVNPEHDEFELAAVRVALVLELPILAICRGFQVLNVALGGTLVQHLTETTTTHRNELHDIELCAGSRTAEAMGAERVIGSSQHHQAVDCLGRGLVLTATAPDGVIEGAELDRGWVVGVQWHPEDTAADDPTQQGLFDAFVEQCRARETMLR